MDTTQTSIKLQAFLAHAGVASRRKSEELIAAGKVTVNGIVAQIGARINPQKDHIALEGKVLSGSEKKRYFLVNKPVGYVSTTADEHNRKTVINLLPAIEEHLYPVGRLDLESEGLMLLTNDGELAQKLTHPKFEIPKTYEVLVSGTPTKAALDHLRSGVKLADGFTKPADVTRLGTSGNDTWLEITITEGRNRQVRRMTERIGYETLKLVRTQMGPFDIGQLDEKPYLELSSEEVRELLEEQSEN